MQNRPRPGAAHSRNLPDRPSTTSQPGRAAPRHNSPMHEPGHSSQLSPEPAPQYRRRSHGSGRSRAQGAPLNSREHTVYELNAGAGGGALGWEQAGFAVTAIDGDED